MGLMAIICAKALNKLYIAAIIKGIGGITAMKQEDFGLGWPIKTMQNAKYLVVGILRNEPSRWFSADVIEKLTNEKGIGYLLTRKAIEIAAKGRLIEEKVSNHNKHWYRARRL